MSTFCWCVPWYLLKTVVTHWNTSLTGSVRPTSRSTLHSWNSTTPRSSTEFTTSAPGVDGAPVGDILPVSVCSQRALNSPKSESAKGSTISRCVPASSWRQASARPAGRRSVSSDSWVAGRGSMTSYGGRAHCRAGIGAVAPHAMDTRKCAIGCACFCCRRWCSGDAVAPAAPTAARGLAGLLPAFRLAAPSSSESVSPSRVCECSRWSATVPGGRPRARANG
jgi:hypothetical protein